MNLSPIFICLDYIQGEINFKKCFSFSKKNYGVEMAVPYVLATEFLGSTSFAFFYHSVFKTPNHISWYVSDSCLLTLHFDCALLFFSNSVHS